MLRADNASMNINMSMNIQYRALAMSWVPRCQTVSVIPTYLLIEVVQVAFGVVSIQSRRKCCHSSNRISSD